MPPGSRWSYSNTGYVNRAAGYRLVDGRLKNQEWVAPKLNTTADGSLYLSVLDLLAWDRGLRAGAVLKPASWEAVYTPVRLNSGRTYPYGFGWDVSETAGQAVHRHGGAWQGFKSGIARFLGSDLTLRPLGRRALGDDRVHTYDVDYGSKPFRVVLDLAPDGKVAGLSVRPR